MEGKPLSSREIVVFHLAATGYTPREIADLRRTSLALRALAERACNDTRSDAEMERDAKKDARLEAEVLAIVNARNQRRFEDRLERSAAACGNPDLNDSHQATFNGDPRGGAVVLKGANGWEIRP